MGYLSIQHYHTLISSPNNIIPLIIPFNIHIVFPLLDDISVWDIFSILPSPLLFIQAPRFSSPSSSSSSIQERELKRAREQAQKKSPLGRCVGVVDGF